MAGKKIEKQHLIQRIVNYCIKHKIKGSFNNPCGDKLVSFEIKENKDKKHLAKGHVKYGCGHETDGVLILDSNELSMAAYLEWSESEGIFGNKSKCFECWCKETEI